MTAFILPGDSASGARPVSPVGPASRSRLLKAGDVAARASALQAEAADAAEQQLQSALQEAYAEGVAAGRQAPEADAAAAALRGAAALEQLAHHAARLEAQQVDVTEAEIFAAVLELTRWILRCDPSQASQSLLGRLSQAAR